MAFVIPVLLLLLFGIVEFGRILGAGLVVNHSARSGARAGAVGGTDAVIISQVHNSVAGLDLTRLVVTIDPTEDNRTRGQQLSVQVSYPVTVTAPFISVFTGDTVTLGATCVMRVE